MKIFIFSALIFCPAFLVNQVTSLQCYGSLGGPSGTYYCPVPDSKFYCGVAYISSAKKGCILKTLCPVVNTLYSENGITKYCCDKDLCNNQTVILLQTTTQVSQITVKPNKIICGFGSSGYTQSIECTNNSTHNYYCSIAYGKDNNFFVKGCILSTLCPVLNIVYIENGTNKFCCDTDNCNDQILLENITDLTASQTTTTFPSVTTHPTNGLICYATVGSIMGVVYCPSVSSSPNYYCAISYESSIPITGCVISTKCSSLHTIFLENGISKYCCNSSFCNNPNPYIPIDQATTTLEYTSTITRTTPASTTIIKPTGLRCKFGSIGATTEIIQCPDSTYYCIVSYGVNFGVMGCISSINCQFLNSVYNENGVYLYCCNKEFCNDRHLISTTPTLTTSTVSPHINLRCYQLLNETLSVTYCPKSSSNFQQFICGVVSGTALFMGCVLSSTCRVLNSIFIEKNISKYCCKTDLCNDHVIPIITNSVIETTSPSSHPPIVHTCYDNTASDTGLVNCTSTGLVKSYCSVSHGVDLVMGCIDASICLAINYVYNENNTNKYCCNSDFCNTPSIFQKTVIPANEILFTTTPTTVGQTPLKCKFGSSGENIYLITCPNSSYYCGVEYGKSYFFMGCILSNSCPVVNTVYLDHGVSRYCCTTDMCNNQFSVRSVIPNFNTFNPANRINSGNQYTFIIILSAIFLNI